MQVTKTKSTFVFATLLGNINYTQVKFIDSCIFSQTVKSGLENPFAAL